MLFDTETDMFGLDSDYDFMTNLSLCDMSDVKSESSGGLVIELCICSQELVDISPPYSFYQVCPNLSLNITPSQTTCIVSVATPVDISPEKSPVSICKQDFFDIDPLYSFETPVMDPGIQADFDEIKKQQRLFDSINSTIVTKLKTITLLPD